MNRWVNIILLTVLAVLVLPASAQASSTSTAAISNPFEGCKEAPHPAKPLSPVGLKPSVTSDEDPFKKDDAPSIESVYGNGYTFFNYDNGCKPGAGVMPSMGSGIGNFGLRVPAAMSSMGHALQRTVIAPTWLKDIDAAVVDATKAARDTVWVPLVGTSMLLVGVLMLWLTRSGRLDGTITTAAWAVLVLTIVTFIAQYPKDATGMVDDTVRSAAITVSTGFSEQAKGEAGESEDRGASRPGEREGAQQDAARVALDSQWDEINRVTSYQTWLEGTFGDAESATAKKYGPRAFKASHLSWSEYDKVNEDPEGEGKKVLEKKEKDFEKVADEIKDEDSYAYHYFTGNDWMDRAGMAPLGIMAALSAILMVLVSAIGMAIGLILIRVLAIFAPAMGVIFLLEPTREWALGLLSKVGKWVLLGPVLLLGGLVVLRVNSAVANSNGDLWSRILIMALVSLVSWWLLRPMGGVPRPHLGRKLLSVTKMAVLGVAAGLASNKGNGDNDNDNGDEQEKPDHDQTPDDKPRPGRGDRPVALPPPPRRYELPPGEQREPVDVGEVQVVRQDPEVQQRDQQVQLRREPLQLSQRAARDASALPAGTTEGRTGNGPGRAPEADDRALPAAPVSSANAVEGEGEGEEEPRLGGASRSGTEDYRTPDGPGRRPQQAPVGHYRPVRRSDEDWSPVYDRQEPSTTDAQRTPIIVSQTESAPGEYRPASSVREAPSSQPSRGATAPGASTVHPEAPQVSEPADGPPRPRRVTPSEDGPAPRVTRSSSAPQASAVEGRVLGSEEDLPSSIDESNVQYGPEGEPVYMVYKPEGSRTYRVE